ncbi:azurin [Aestuariivivens sediminicola]|uniref:azurin n=1 Tax=Aestuariivivens sediminicola TaxID=2913560 RepID=UPI001F58CCDD|nr:azurin [Aestuariivivens sediminicola]
MNVIKQMSLAMLTGLLLLSCGNKEDKKKESFSYEKQAEEPQKQVEDGVANLVISGDDLMKFDKTELRVKAGDKVKLTLRHIGKLDKNVMGHNFVVLKKGVDLVAFGIKAASARDTDYIPADAAGDIIAHTKLIGGGETTSIEFEAPESGEYEFLCSFPGHYAMMRGKLIVE